MSRPERAGLAAAVPGAAMVGMLWGPSVPADVHASLFQNLLTCSAMVFGVMGAWVEIIYPRVMAKVSDEETSDHLEKARHHSSLRPALITSSFVLTLVLLPAPAGAFVVDQSFYKGAEPWLLRGSMFALVLLTFIELYTVLASLAPFVTTQDAVDAKAKRQRVIEAVSRNATPASS